MFGGYPDTCFAQPEFLAARDGLAVGWQTRGSPYPYSPEQPYQSSSRFGVREHFELV